MNFALRHPDNHQYCLIGIARTAHGDYVVSSVYLHPSGSLRTQGESNVYKTKDAALRRVKALKRMKKKRRGFVECGLLDVPKPGLRYMKTDLDTYIPPEEMLDLLDEAIREYYVEFDSVLGIEERFDEGIEYLALRDREDGDYYDVYDRFGALCKCSNSRFSRCEPTERAIEVLNLKGEIDKEYACHYCKDSDHGCVHCTS